MRPMLVTAILGAALITLGACSKDDNAFKDGATPNPSGSVVSTDASGGPGGGQGGADRKASCAELQKAQAAAEAKFLVVLPKAAEAMADKSKAPAAITEIKTAVADFEKVLITQSAQTKDAELRSALDTDVLALHKAQLDVQAAGTDVTKALEALQTDEFKSVGEKAKSLCGI